LKIEKLRRRLDRRHDAAFQDALGLLRGSAVLADSLISLVPPRSLKPGVLERLTIALFHIPVDISEVELSAHISEIMESEGIVPTAGREVMH
jgi:hypothetical protein